MGEAEEVAEIRQKEKTSPGEEGEELAEVVPCSTEQGIDPISEGILVIITVHAMVRLEVTDDRLDRSAASPPTALPRRRSLFPPVDDVDLHGAFVP